MPSRPAPDEALAAACASVGLDGDGAQLLLARYQELQRQYADTPWTLGSG